MPTVTRPLLTEKQVAELLGICPATLRNWRVKGFGPPFVRVGRRIRYQPDVVEAWIAERSASSTAEADVAALRRGGNTITAVSPSTRGNSVEQGE